MVAEKNLALPALQPAQRSSSQGSGSRVVGLHFSKGECPLFPFETAGAGLDFVYDRLKAKNELAIREVMGDPLQQEVDRLKKEKADLRLRLEALKGKKVDPSEVFPLYENVIEKQINRNKAVSSFLRKTKTDDLALITNIGELCDRLDRVGMEDKRIFDMNRRLVEREQKCIRFANENAKLLSDKRNLEYREKNLLLANQLLKSKADEAHAKMLHFKALFSEKQKELDVLTNSSNFITMLSEDKSLVSKRKAGELNGGEEQWKRGFDQMRIELMHLMRLYNIQRGKLEYAQKQKQLSQARTRIIKADLSKAWRELSDPSRNAPPPRNSTAYQADKVKMKFLGLIQQGKDRNADQKKDAAPEKAQAPQQEIVDDTKDTQLYELSGPGLGSEPFPLGNYYLSYLITAKGENAKLFLDECVAEDREKCELLLNKEFVANYQRQKLVQKLLISGSRLQEITDADLALRNIQTMSKSYLSADRVTVWVVDHTSHICWTRSSSNAGEPFEIKIPMSKGLVGDAATTGKAINIKDAYQDPRFNRSIDLQTGYRTKEVLCQPIVVNYKVVAVLQAINKLYKVDHTASDLNFHNKDTGFSKEDEFFLSIIGILGHSTLVACESKQGDLFAVRRTQTLLDATLEIQADPTHNPMDVLHLVTRHMTSLFKAISVQLFLIKHRETNLLKTVRYDGNGFQKPIDFDLYEMYMARKIDSETGEYSKAGQSACFTCMIDEAPVSYFKMPEEYNDEIDLLLSHANKPTLRLAKPNLHQFPIFKRVRKQADGGLSQQKRGPLLGVIQWTSDGEISTFGDDGLFKGANNKAHSLVMWKYTDILSSCLEYWLGEIQRRAGEDGEEQPVDEDDDDDDEEKQKKRSNREDLAHFFTSNKKHEKRPDLNRRLSAAFQTDASGERKKILLPETN